MSLVHASIIPYSKELLTSDESTDVRAALKEVEGELYVMQPDTIIVLSPNLASTDAFYVHMAQQFELNLQNADASLENREFAADLEIISKLRSGIDGYDADFSDLQIHASDESNLSESTSIALYALTQHLPNVQLVPITLAPTSMETQMLFGQFLHSVAVQTNKRLACIVPAHLSAVSNPSAAGYTPDGATFDKFIKDHITAGNLERITDVNIDLINKAQVHDIQSLSVLAGLLSAIEYKASINYSGYLGADSALVAQFTLI